ncbi:hypothetical protein [Paracoccus yeei]|uniref:hypothetical protein n=1 Tax=Paracoccus yeei TaxID=147645 RepID=UPI001C8F0AF9|nr:hypothetical protein [Paracoccus yeei]MBY0134476.1 hypothetical protein [Paracoccus yeei]
MALATLSTVVNRTITDRRIWSDIIREYGSLNAWWSTVEGMAYRAASSEALRIRPRVGSLDQVGTGLVPFRPDGYKPASFANVEGEPRFRASFANVSTNLISLFAVGNSAENFTEIMGLRWGTASLGLRILHNNYPAITSGTGTLYRNTSTRGTNLDTPYLIAAVIDFANAQAALSVNGEPFVSGAFTGTPPAAPAAQDLTVDIGAQVLANGNAERFNGWIGEVGIGIGRDFRAMPGLMADLASYARDIWGIA